ncbi:procollagen-lysine,2-oxoglutarate 5-dioxygenase 1 [Frankliniella occidentalis]|uniref:procollagen-lysine 5-dioxygenase n=1 Tax=Frankliniella occidentalis TaxID=133901 RepID=A0A9C6WZZ3_FRAOC|nr:procollagen-lysine,2-oxoglutarate 5-dioxygenase 1 [Frankliniella occidentalis]
MLRILQWAALGLVLRGAPLARPRGGSAPLIGITLLGAHTTWAATDPMSQGAIVLASRARGESRELCGDLDADVDVDLEELEAAERWLLPYHEVEADPDEYLGWGFSSRYPLRSSDYGNHTSELLLLTVASHPSDGYRRFERSAQIFNVPMKVLGMGKEWNGGDMSRPGGGYKINLLKEELEQYKNDSNKIILFTDAFDVVILANADKISKQFRSLDGRIVFSAEGFCWPDESLASNYPTVARGKRFLNSGGFIGYAPELYQLVTSKDVQDTDDDQLFYTHMYLDAEIRKQLNIKLDHRSTIFQNLNGALADVELQLEAGNSYIKNTAYSTIPLIVHGNGPSKTVLNSLGNYIAKSWSLQDGCLLCDDNKLDLSQKKESQLPSVLIAVFIEQPTPFLEEFFEKIAKLDYPKSRLFLFIHNAVEYHSSVVQEFKEKYSKLYRSVKSIDFGDKMTNAEARELAMSYCVQKECSAYLNVDAEAHLDNSNALRLLLETNRGVVAPMLTRPYKAWSNFWGALSTDGFYARSTDYMEIVNLERRGLWNVPYISGCYLVNATILADKKSQPSYSFGTLDPDMAFCHSLREKGSFMFVSNLHDFGHLVNTENYDLTHTHPDFYTLVENRWDWEQRYIHQDYANALDPQSTPLQPCPDVYWFPVVTPRFCQELIDIMENFGRWSDGSNKDERLAGGYENVPTRDIHMNQVGFDPQWLEFLKSYVKPLVERVFTGYNNDTPRSIMNFVVRYRPDEQPSLRPHHDSSTYTINLALNRPEVDYQGGGCNFIRYNCKVTKTRVGWLLMHPGRLTHLHEGLPVTNGTRYIMISFVDP